MAKHVTACDVRATCQTICTIMRHLHKFTTIRKRIILIHSETTAHSVKEANVAVSKSLFKRNMTFPLKVTRISRDNVYIHKPHTDTIYSTVSASPVGHCCEHLPSLLPRVCILVPVTMVLWFVATTVRSTSTSTITNLCVNILRKHSIFITYNDYLSFAGIIYMNWLCLCSLST